MYDSMYIDTGLPMKTQDYDLSQMMRGAMYPLRYNVTSGGTPLPGKGIRPFGEPGSATQGSCSPAINTSNPPGNIGEGVTKLASSAYTQVSSFFSKPDDTSFI